MEKGWVKIYTSQDSLKAELVMQLLRENDMEVVLMNKKDSSYLNFGEIELYIHQNHFEQAVELIIRNDL